ncbi:MAG: toll/interleukin-1 receptor domain-containing protein [Burkholderiaceae bacterium]|nr:toll/interleukin-1 receptor domain-containing protein [Burkholderiaceae bacterium]
MNIFISWSGDHSRRLALELHVWLASVVQAAKPWMSERDIGPGERWNEEVSQRLRDTNFGIICITSSNMTSPWLLFEAGALAKALEKSKVVPVLFGVKPSDLKFPLAQFQAVSTSRDGMFSLVTAVNKALDQNQLSLTTLNSVFGAMWGEFEKRLTELGDDAATGSSQHRSDRDILEELNDTVRNLSRSLESAPLGMPQSTSGRTLSLSSWEEHYVRGVNAANTRSGPSANTEALLEYAAAIALAPATLPRNTISRLYSYRGAMLKRLRRLEEAEQDIQLALKLATGPHELNDANWNMACIEAMTGRHTEALARLQHLIAQDSRWVRATQTAPYFKDLHGKPEFTALLGEA